MTGPPLRACVLYPEILNVYADRGNLMVLERRCEWRGIPFELASASFSDRLDSRAHDLFYIGGGQDADQLRCAADLLETKAHALREAAERGAVILGICGGYQLLGSRSWLGDVPVDGVGLLDVRTEREPGPRLIGAALVDVEFGDGDGLLAGFENHAGRTYLGPGAAPLGMVSVGKGNNGKDGTEGARALNVIGTYLHGPLLPKNSWFADWLIRTSLGIEELSPLSDRLEGAAHQMACDIARTASSRPPWR